MESSRIMHHLMKRFCTCRGVYKSSWSELKIQINHRNYGNARVKASPIIADSNDTVKDWTNKEVYSEKINRMRRNPEDELVRDPDGEAWETSKISSHIYKGICPWKSKEELADFLCENIIYESDGVIAINKPFGIGVLNIINRNAVKREQTLNMGKPDPKKTEPLRNLFHSRGVASTHYTLEDLVPSLRERLGLQELELVKSPEKFASGIAVFGANEFTAKKLQLCIKKTKQRKICASNYLVISTHIPKLDCGALEQRVGIMLMVNETTNVKQPVIRPDFSKRAMFDGIVYPAHVEIILMNSNNSLGVACVEIRTDQTRWNFLRVYSAHNLMPLLGDHLYSARVQSIMGVKTALPPLSIEPGATNQKLTKEVICALGLIKPEDSLIIPLHAHLQSYTISNFYKSKKKCLLIEAPPPDFFQWTRTRLGLNPS